MSVRTPPAAPQILIVDDDPQVLGFLAKVLRNRGYAVTDTTSGTEAVEMLRQRDFDLMVLDLEMPNIDGFDIIKLTRPKRLEMKIIAVSGYLGGVFLEAAELLGAVSAIQKPVAAAALLAKVQEAIGKSSE